MTRMLRQVLLAAAGGVALLAPGCSCSGGGPAPRPLTSGDGVLERLVLRPENQGAPISHEPVVVSEFTPPRELEPWQAEAKSMGVRDVQLAEGTEPTKLLVLRGEGKKRVLIPGTYDPRAFNRVAVAVVCDKREDVQVICRNKGRNLVFSEALSAEASREPVLLVFDLPTIRRLKQPFDEILVTFAGKAKFSAIEKVALLERPLDSFLPTPEGGPDLVQMRPDLVELRRGVGLASDRPLVAEVNAQVGCELTFSYGAPDKMRVGGERPRISVTLTSPSGRTDSRELELEDKLKARSTWHQATMDLAPFAGETVTVRFELTVRGDQRGFCVIGEPRVRRPTRDAPTVLLITSDTHRADHMGAAGEDSPVKTPTLDALGARGVYFEDCYASTNVTNPSHVALMTAIHPRDTRIVDNDAPLIGDANTLAERFRAAGYRTVAAVSARHLVHEESGLGQGFDRMSAPRRADRDADPTLDVLDEWLEDAAGEPLFVWLHIFDAHSPYGPPEPFDGRYYPGGRQKAYDPATPLAIPEEAIPPFLKDVRDVEYPYAQYRAEVDYLDAQLKRILERERFLDGIVAFTADHGESFGQHGVYWDHAELYPDTVHIPLILTWPGAPAGVRVDQPVKQVDIGRTLLDLAGLEDAEFHGRDLRWTLEDGSPEPRFLISAQGSSAAVSSGNWHLILHLRKHRQQVTMQQRAEHEVELYDTSRDPECENDLAAEEFERARAMRASLVRWLLDAKSEGLGTTGSMKTASHEALVALGYASDEPSGPDAGEPWIDGECTCEWCTRYED